MMLKLSLLLFLTAFYMGHASTYAVNTDIMKASEGETFHDFKDLSKSFFNLIREPKSHIKLNIIDSKTGNEHKANGVYRLYPYYQKLSTNDEQSSSSQFLIQKHPFNGNWHLSEIYGDLKRKIIYPTIDSKDKGKNLEDFHDTIIFDEFEKDIGTPIIDHIVIKTFNEIQEIRGKNVQLTEVVKLQNQKIALDEKLYKMHLMQLQKSLHYYQEENKKLNEKVDEQFQKNKTLKSIIKCNDSKLDQFERINESLKTTNIYIKRELRELRTKLKINSSQLVISEDLNEALKLEKIAFNVKLNIMTENSEKLISEKDEKILNLTEELNQLKKQLELKEEQEKMKTPNLSFIEEKLEIISQENSIAMEEKKKNSDYNFKPMNFNCETENEKLYDASKKEEEDESIEVKIDEEEEEVKEFENFENITFLK